jgi:hypothetical protein
MLGQFREGHSENPAQLEHRSKRRALDSTFEQANVRPVKLAFKRQCLLGETAVQSESAQRLSERFFGSSIRLNMPALSLHRQALWCYFVDYRATDYSPNLKEVIACLAPRDLRRLKRNPDKHRR